MTAIDPIIERRFGWTRGLDPARLLTDPALALRFVESYADDPDYTAPEVRTEQVRIDGPLGAGSLRVRVYLPDDAPRRRPALVWAHGGGFAGGTLDGLEADAVSREVCARGDVTVISVDYHLADGSHSYPSLHREVIAAFNWTVDPDGLAIEAGRVALGGASAGANLAVAATLELRDGGHPLPADLVLAYPMLHTTAPGPPPSSESIDTVPELLRIRQPAIDHMYAAYRGAVPAGNARYLSVEGHDLTGLPRCLAVIAEYDDLRGSAETFAADARAAGTDVSEYLACGMPHGHLAMPATVPETARTLQVIADYVANTPCGPPSTRTTPVT